MIDTPLTDATGRNSPYYDENYPRVTLINLEFAKRLER